MRDIPAGMKVALFLALVACGGSKPATVGSQPPPAKIDPSCPLAVPGTSISEEDTPAGAALVFVTTPASLDAVRKSGATLAEMHNKESGPADAMGMMIKTKSNAVVEDIPTGTRVVFTPATPDEMAGLQEELRMHAGMMKPGSCAMAM
ncbi:MAG: hypothetical protein QM831_23410 [Kofleriaceae bacterium]